MADRYENRYGRERGYGRSGRDDDRGFMERAGEQVRSWFGDDDDDGRERGYRGGYGGGDRDRPDRDRMSYGARGYSAQGNDEYRRDEGRRPMTGDYGRGGRDYGHDEDRPRSYGAGGYGGRNYGGMDAGHGMSSGGRYEGRVGGAQGVHDPHYHDWRERQMSDLDRDYHEYRQEHQQRFESEFGSWRTARQGQREALRQVKEHQEVVGDDGEPVGTVDKVRGDQIILTKNDAQAGGRHHSIPSSWIQGVGEKVMLNRSGEKARAAWSDWEREAAREHEAQGRTTRGDRALGHENDRDDTGPHILDRSFSGTYDR